MLAPRDWFVAWLGARIRCYYKQFVLALKLLQQTVDLNATTSCYGWSWAAVSRRWAWRAGAALLRAGATTQS